jgi:hypothetical protein
LYELDITVDHEGKLPWPDLNWNRDRTFLGQERGKAGTTADGNWDSGFWVVNRSTCSTFTFYYWFETFEKQKGSNPSWSHYPWSKSPYCSIAWPWIENSVQEIQGLTLQPQWRPQTNRCFPHHIFQQSTC